MTSPFPSSIPSLPTYNVSRNNFSPQSPSSSIPLSGISPGLVHILSWSFLWKRAMAVEISRNITEVFVHDVCRSSFYLYKSSRVARMQTWDSWCWLIFSRLQKICQDQSHTAWKKKFRTIWLTRLFEIRMCVVNACVNHCHHQVVTWRLREKSPGFHCINILSGGQHMHVDMLTASSKGRNATVDVSELRQSPPGMYGTL